ncbi:MAG: hypothetical protein M5R42_00300 [Rhodocyclaceae bacterium]|nr:hypothetical protein [Rhodocyclaceae bacterium]
MADAEIEVESGAFRLSRRSAPGIYALPGEAFANPGKYPLAISVQAGDTADLLTATLDLAPPEVSVAHATGWDKWATTVAWAPRARCCSPAPASLPFAAAIASTEGLMISIFVGRLAR